MLKRIELKNFKSFKSLSLDIPKGFVAIVGPNGSGKSNIVDAILFVLGKSSAKKLRANRFSSLINYHKGRRAEYAEATLYFETDGKEFGILRRVKKSGETEYFLIENNDKKRLTKREVIELFRRLKLLGDNVISQGDLLNIINMSPIERRKIIDELSGVAEFDEKKKKAEEELKKAKELIEIIDARIEEVKSNLNKLKKEKEEAERYLKLKEELKEVKYTLSLKRVEYLKMLIENLSNNIDNLEREKEKLLDKIKELNREEERKNERLKEIMEKLGDNEGVKIYNKIKELEIEIRHDKNILNNLNNEINRLDEEEKKLDNSYSNETNKIKELEEEINKNNEKIKSIVEKLNLLRKDYLKIRLEIKEREEDLNNLKNKKDKITDEMEKLKTKLLSLKEEINKLNSEIYRREIEIKNNLERIDKLKKEMNFEKIDTKSLYIELENLSIELKFLEKKFNEIKEIEEKLKSEISELNSEYLKERAKIKAMEEINVDRAVKEILNLPGVIDIVGNLGKTKAKYRKAIEVAGGNRLNYIVTETTEDAINAINYLKAKNLGRLTFLPLDKIRGKRADHINEPGVVGRAIDLVDFNLKFEKVFEFVFGNTIIVENLRVAKELSNKYRARFVTLDGDVIESSGALVGGSYRGKALIKVDEEEKIKELENKILKKELKLREVEKEIKELKNKIREVERKKIRVEERLESIKEEERRREKIVERNKIEIKELELKNKILLEEIERLKDEKTKKINEIKEIEEKIKKLENDKLILEKEMEELGLSSKINIINSLEKEIVELNNEKIKLEKEIEKNRALIDMIKNNILELQKRKEEIKRKKEAIINNIKIYKENIKAKEEELNKLLNIHKQISETIKELNNEKIKLEKEIEKIINEKNKIEEEIKEIEREINNLYVEKAKYESKLEEEERKLYLCESLEVKDKYLNMDIKDLELLLGKIEDEIRKLEPVNMRAIEDYKIVYERYKELIKKREEYEKEEKKYIDMVKEIEKRKKEVFLEVFNRVAKNFEEVYKDIGGVGKLRLENREDPFSGGLLIDASPKGKKLLSLELMSGGEKSLAALAFLFAIQKLNPSSFYVLDEVDSALDVKNVSLIADMIKNLSKDSQFIVISHREQMISKADVVYGVYMEDGVSKVVGIKL
ncbi:chromosome segregation protein SMC [Methanocaldococcus sp.]